MYEKWTPDNSLLKYLPKRNFFKAVEPSGKRNVDAQCELKECIGNQIFVYINYALPFLRRQTLPDDCLADCRLHTAVALSVGETAAIQMTAQNCLQLDYLDSVY